MRSAERILNCDSVDPRLTTESWARPWGYPPRAGRRSARETYLGSVPATWVPSQGTATWSLQVAAADTLRLSKEDERGENPEIHLQGSQTFSTDVHGDLINCRHELACSVGGIVEQECEDA